jgi:tripartite-type tricarboxylate transporter receptor subunit TctC
MAEPLRHRQTKEANRYVQATATASHAADHDRRAVRCGRGAGWLGRILAERMRAPLGQTIIVENVPGASGRLGVGRVARAAPDGYTLVIGY